MTQKYALVTGSTRGIGKEIAFDLLKSGAYVFINYATSDAVASQVAEECKKISNKFRLIKADLSTVDGLDILFGQVFSESKTIDYLILNAGATRRSNLQTVTLDDWDYVFNCNLKIPFFLVKSIDKNLNDDGRIILIGSVLGHVPHSVSIPYGVSKGALSILSKYLAKEFSSRRITVNIISPGFIKTSWHEGKDDAQLKRIEETIALKRFGTTSEISKMCMHLIDNGYITGQEIFVDGGYAT